MNVELNMTEEQLMSIVQNAVQKEVKRRIEECTSDRGVNVVFTRSNMEDVAREVITEQYLPKMNVKFTGELKINFRELARIMTESVETYLTDTVEASLISVGSDEDDIL